MSPSWSRPLTYIGVFLILTALIILIRVFVGASYAADHIDVDEILSTFGTKIQSKIPQFLWLAKLFCLLTILGTAIAGFLWINITYPNALSLYISNLFSPYEPVQKWFKLAVPTNLQIIFLVITAAAIYVLGSFITTALLMLPIFVIGLPVAIIVSLPTSPEDRHWPLGLATLLFVIGLLFIYYSTLYTSVPLSLPFGIKWIFPS